MVLAVSGILYPAVRENAPVPELYDRPVADDERELSVIKLLSFEKAESVVGNVASDRSPRRY